MTYWDELSRKSIHLGSAIFPVLYWYTDRAFMLRIMIPLVIFALTLETARMLWPSVELAVQRVLGKILRAEEKRLFTGATYVALAVLTMIWFFDKTIAVPALLFMSISDALASLVGLRVGGPRFLGKTVSGSSAFFVSALLIAMWFMPHAPIAGFVGAAFATIVEAAPLRYGMLKIDDNLAIPLTSGIAMWLIIRSF